MKTRWCWLPLAGLFAACLWAAEEPEPMRPTGRIALFDGKTLDGWRPFAPKAADPAAVWVVKDGVIHCQGRPSGYLRTERAYADYRLRLEWRWAGKPANSGVLLHMSGEDRVWPKSIECQLMNRNAGDFFVIGGTDFKEHEGIEGRRVPKKHDTNEKPPGEWNQLEVVCAGDSIRIVVNGLLQNEATECTVTGGRICLQSEGGPIEFKNITVEPVE